MPANSIAQIFAMVCNSKYVWDSGLVTRCKGCSGEGQTIGYCTDKFGLPSCFKPTEPARINRPTIFVGKVSQVYLSTLYHRSYEADLEKEVIDEAKKTTEQAASGLLNGAWMIQPVDRTLRIHEQSKLAQVGGLAMRGDVELISMKYFLRQASRRFGTHYEKHSFYVSRTT